jgi:hypothetical protein
MVMRGELYIEFSPSSTSLQTKNLYDIILSQRAIIADM